MKNSFTYIQTILQPRLAKRQFASLGLFSFVLLSLLIGFVPKASAQCDFQANTPISFQATGGNTAANYVNQYLLTDDLGTILEVASTPSFSGKPAGVYIIYTINYESTSTVTGNQVGGKISQVTGDCLDISAPLAISVCSLNEVCDFSQTQSISFNAAGGNTDPAYSNLYALTDFAGVIVQTSLSPSFSAQTAGVYLVFNINYLTSEGITNASVGQSITNVTGNCFAISDPLAIHVCQVLNLLTATNDAANVTSGLSAPIAILANDSLNGSPVQRADINAPTITVQPTKGTVVVNADGTLTYTANANATGTDTFTYQICLASEPTNCATAQVTMSIADAPIANVLVANPDLATVTAGLDIVIPVLMNDRLNGNPVQQTDVNGPTITVQPTQGTVVVNADGTITYRPNANATGTDTFTYQICSLTDPANCSTAQVTASILAAPSLTIQKLAPTSANVGLNFDYTLQVTNVGGAATSGIITVTDVLTEDLNFITSSSTSGWSCFGSGQVVTCTTTTPIAVNGTSTITLTVNSFVSKTYTNTASVFGGNDPVAVNFANARSSNTVTTVVGDQVVRVNARVFLYGAYNVATGLMTDDLRVANRIPLTQPYSLPAYSDISYMGNETVTPTVLTVTGANAIVDWVVVELRDRANPSVLVARKAALLQRDGDIVETDGVTTVAIPGISAGDYFVAVRHRNHLGVMTQNPMALSTTALRVDFTTISTPTFRLSGDFASAFPQIEVSTTLTAMWAGNTTRDGRVIFQGTANDVNPVFSRVLSDPSNTSLLNNFISIGYERSDVNMDGRTVYQGSGNEVNFLFSEVLTHPENLSLLNNFIIYQQLP